MVQLTANVFLKGEKCIKVDLTNLIYFKTYSMYVYHAEVEMLNAEVEMPNAEVEMPKAENSDHEDEFPSMFLFTFIFSFFLLFSS